MTTPWRSTGARGRSLEAGRRSRVFARFKFPLAPGWLGAEQAAKGTKAHRARGDCGIRHRVNHAQILSGEEWRLALRWR